jgi:methionine-rich copper-binding protein CopC
MKHAIWLSLLTLPALTCAGFAHAMLENAQPSAGAVVHGSPTTLRLDFGEPLEPAFSGVTVTDSGGQSVASGAAAIAQSAMSVPLKPLRAGRYRVSWHAVSVDTHRTEGAYTFTVAP